ncbi:MAG: CooT family nickel-binding protein [Candidatus Helarchaeota archaeon]|nr:CooT family nickel-binding protein [Candidatus Helarchaeota archaeon]
MCEFKVKMTSENDVKDVCKDVLYAKIDENIILRDILGTTNTVESAIITEVSVPSAKMTLLYSPILKNILKLLKLQNKCFEEGKFDKKMTEIWEQVKKEGDIFINSLQNKLG